MTHDPQHPEQDASARGTAPARDAHRLLKQAATRFPRDVPHRERTPSDGWSRVVDLAGRLLNAGSSQLSLVTDAQHVIAAAGLARHTTGEPVPVEDSLCAVTVDAGTAVVIADASADPRVASRAPVASGAVGAYLGVPLVTAAGHVVGALCVFDPTPRAWSRHDVALLEDLARPAVAELELASLLEAYEDDRAVWRLAVDAAGVGAYDWDLASGRLRWDDRLLELFGLDHATFGGTIDAFHASVHPDDRDRVATALDRAVAGCGTFEAEYRVLLPDGSLRWITSRGHALPGPDGRSARLLGAAYDSTAVRDGEARVARVLESMPSAFYQLDTQWRFSYVNAEAERLLGRPREELLGGVLWDLFPATVGGIFEERYRAAAASSEADEFEAYYPPPLDGWYDLRVWPQPDGLAVYFSDVTHRRRTQQRLDDAAERTALGARVTEALAGTLDLTEAARQVPRLLVPGIADWCIISLLDEPHGTSAQASPLGDWRDRLHDLDAWHRDPALRPAVDAYIGDRLVALSGESFLERALATGRPVVVPGNASAAMLDLLRPGPAREAVDVLCPSSAAFVPLRARGATVGVLSVFRDQARPALSHDDVDLLADIGARAGLVVDNARLFSQQRDLAEGLQRSMLTAPPEPDHLHVVVRYQPATDAAQVGGDWYDAFFQNGESTVVAIGDVVGHDVAAAAAMGQIRSIMRGIAAHTGDGPAAILHGVDTAMSVLNLDTMATAVVARLEQTPEERDAGLTRVRWSNAGHLAPVVVNPDRTISTLEADRVHPLLGLSPTIQRTDSEATLERGATVLLYTDGLVERRGEHIDDGVARLTQALADLAAEDVTTDELCDRLLERLVPHGSGDDIALVAVRLYPEDQPRPPEAGPGHVEPGPPTA